MDLKHILRQIQTDNANLFHGRLLQKVINVSILAHRCRRGASTPSQPSEVLALRLADVTDDGLIVDKTKFKKSRLLPLHPSTRRPLYTYTAASVLVASHSDVFLL